MNTPDHNLPIDDELLFDLLVDDELQEEERRQLLVRLDDTLGGWRRCALAFLEAQCLKRELRHFVRPSANELPRCAGKDRPRRRWHLGTLLAMAASFFVALGLGVLLQDALRSGDLRPDRQFQLVDTSQEPTGPAQPARPGVDGQTGQQPWQMVTLTLDKDPDGTERVIRVPAIESDKLDARWLDADRSAIPPNLREALERSGYEIRQSRQLLPLRMDDGRRVVFPLDEVDIHYADDPAYQ